MTTSIVVGMVLVLLVALVVLLHFSNPDRRGGDESHDGDIDDLLEP